MESGHKKEVSSVRRLRVVKVLKKEVIVTFDEIVHERELNEAGELVREDKFTKNVPLRCDFPPHEDLINAMKMFRKHFIAIWGFKGEIKNFGNYTTTGVIFHDMDDDESAKLQIVCTKKIEATGQVSSLGACPPTTITNEEVYGDALELGKAALALEKEAYAYVDGKHAESKQMELQFEDGENMQMKVEHDN